ncbi:MAG: hypothetical protein ACI4QL_00540, partial [Candidatus Fimimonas sp.]
KLVLHTKNFGVNLICGAFLFFCALTKAFTVDYMKRIFHIRQSDGAHFTTIRENLSNKRNESCAKQNSFLVNKTCFTHQKFWREFNLRCVLFLRRQLARGCAVVRLRCARANFQHTVRRV